MGDRANVLVKENDADSGVYLYTHWGGHDLPFTLAAALGRRLRWDDAPYLTRIIFCEMVKGNEQGETGFGISSFCGDGKDRVLVVNVDTQRVTWKDRSWSFADFATTGSSEIDGQF